ncbi:MAG: hypothetical protein ABS96_05460 [Lysobacteraceae bacterium SCN 69-123]|nr:MAG: hypothetical protein ABS96_05460 [Xanthomonadaceae bacterium SCN 69-123]
MAGILAQPFEHQRGLDRVDARSAPQVLAEAASLARARQVGTQACRVAAGHQVQFQQRMAVAIDGFAQVGGDGVGQAAFDAVLAGHAFALQLLRPAMQVAPVRDDRLQRAAGMALAEMPAPVEVEAAVGRLQRRDVHAARVQRLHPGAVRAELRPAAAAQRQ